MPNNDRINNLKEALKTALVTASQNSSRRITSNAGLTISDEELERARPSQEIDAQEISTAITNEVTVRLLNTIEQLEGRIENLETRIQELGSVSPTGFPNTNT